MSGLDLVRRYYAAIDEGRYDDCAVFFTEDATMQIAHHPPIAGRDAIVAMLHAGLRTVASIRHEVLRSWPTDDGIIVEVDAHYTFADDRNVTVPGAVIARIVEGRFAAQRIHADLSITRG